MFLMLKKNIFHDGSKLLLSVGAISCVVCLMIVIESVLFGTLKEFSKYSEKVGADIFVTQKGSNNMDIDPSVLPINIKSDLKNIDGIKDVFPIYGTRYHLEFKNKKLLGYLIGYDPKFKIGGPWKIVAGKSTINEKEIIIDEFLAKYNSIKIGDYVRLDGKKFKVVGFSTETNRLSAQYFFITKNDASKVLKLKGFVNYFLITLDNPKEDNADIISDIIDFKIQHVNAYPKNIFKQYNQDSLKSTIYAPMQLAVFVSFMVGVLIVGLSVYTSTLNRIKDYTI